MVAHSTFTLGNAERDLGDLASAAARYGDALQPSASSTTGSR